MKHVLYLSPAVLEILSALDAQEAFVPEETETILVWVDAPEDPTEAELLTLMFVMVDLTLDISGLLN